ncbi:hypothetical protein LWI29_024807 [Acer saccharum]|uniref:Uncharacterized protein n=1 Tax=Acer saccharum TaxID=4024 RepID=A0AA39W8R6_ACESA|nr:hypothetical protein LWI29_024807 [Acer saccharum]
MMSLKSSECLRAKGSSALGALNWITMKYFIYNRKNSRDRHVITMEGQVSRGQDKSTYGVGTFTITYSEKRISSPTTNKDDQLEQQIGFGLTRAHSGTLGHTHSGNNKTVANTCNQQPAGPR